MIFYKSSSKLAALLENIIVHEGMRYHCVMQINFAQIKTPGFTGFYPNEDQRAMELGLGHFQPYIVVVSFIDGGNWSTWRKPQTCR